MKAATRKLASKIIAIATLTCMATQSTLAAFLDLSDVPLFIGASVPPQVMLTLSKEQQLFKKAYNDYSDLDGDGQLETTYKHSINYYGYFDPAKCYNYSTTNQRFEPASVSATKYCSGNWSGNFLNWAAMSRMDAVRKLLYGGMRSTDTATATVLERSYLPMDAHAWAKYYNGNDIAQLTPFNPPVAAPVYPSQGSNTFTIPSSNGDYTVTFDNDVSAMVVVGEQLRLVSAADSSKFMLGAVLSLGNSNRDVRMRVDTTGVGGSGAAVNSWNITNLSRTGISICNLTTGSGGSGQNEQSHTNTNPPLIRVAQGNFQLWNANERYQCYWSNEKSDTQGGFNGVRSNGNQGSLSEIYASAENPSQSAHGLGTGAAQGEYNVRVEVCVTNLFGTERCKQYPNGNYKPIGLLQEYGDVNLIQFGLMTGSYTKNVSGGVLRKNIGTFTDEVNVNTDGTFTTPAQAPGSPRSFSAVPTPPGIVNTLNYLRIWGYDYREGLYNAVDSCGFQLTNIVENTCTSWGNPMSEIYFESLRYFAGNSPSSAFTYTNDGSKDNQLGLPLASWTDPLSSANYCAPINVLVFNASVTSKDDDLRDTSAAAISSTSTAAQLTNNVGAAEGLSGSYFFGRLLGASATPASDPGFKLCTPKNITGLGDVSGICPEGPTIGGSYLLAGLSHFAHTNRIRTNIDIPTSDTRSLKVTTYGIQLATNVPQLVIPVPGTAGRRVVIQPIYQLQVPPGSFGCSGSTCIGGGTLVDLKLIRQEISGSISRGKAYINWEDSEQGGDYDQDMWGTLEWEVNAAAGTVTITTNAISQSTVNPQGFGYTISGTTQDGPHFHSGILGFNYTDATGVLGCTNCQISSAGFGQRGPQGQIYTLGQTTAQTLQDPLWYTAKYGAFIDGNGNGVPDLQSEWDSRFSNGQQGSDGVPDTYFQVTNPLGLVAALDRAFVAILATSSASSVATNSTSLQTGTTIYQARFNANDWSGQVLAFAVNSQGQIAQNPTWDAGQIINSQNPLDTGASPAAGGSGRTIITYNRAQQAGVPFRWPANPASPATGEISQELVDNLNLGSGSSPAPDGHGRDRLEYLRGSQANEGSSVLSFRPRPISRLGDIVNSNPNFVAAPNAGFGEASYSTFRQANTNRAAMVYVGGNDGMLHGFRAADGRELLAYVPSMVHKKLNLLTDKTYNSQHKYFVDGSPEVGDAFIKVGGVDSWQTVLVGTMGGGGQGLYALNVTNPDQFSETNAARTVLWEFSDKDDPDLGFIYAQPTIRRMANGKFAAIIPGGYNQSKPETGETACTDSATRTPAGCTTSSTGSAYLFIVFLDGPGADGVWDEGTDYVKIRAATGSDSPTTPNGLSQPLAADIDADGFVDFIYAGDLQGNLWKFDVRLPAAASPLPAVPNTTASVSQWTSGDNRVILFVARDPDTNQRQPITAKPEATLAPLAGFIVTFGTGKFIERNDPFPPSGPPPNPPGPYQTQSFYGIYDKNDATPIAIANSPDLAPSPRQTVVTSRGQLLPHVIASSTADPAIRVVTQATGAAGLLPDVPDYSTIFDPANPGVNPPPNVTDVPPKHLGWLLDFPNATTTGERSVFRPILTAGRLIFTTLLPLAQACQFGGTSFIMVIDPTTGGRIDGPVLDTDRNGLLNTADVVTFGGRDIYASGMQSTIGITPTPTIIRAGAVPPDTSSAASRILGTSGPLVSASGVLLAYALAAGSSGGNASTVIGLSASGGRVSWRELTSD